MGTIERFVLDTSLFTNPHAYACFDRDPEPAMRSFLGLAGNAAAEFYMPTSVFEELRLMRELGELEAEFELRVHIRSPRKHALQIPAYILYEFIEEVRQRMDRGLRVAEEHARLGQQGETDAGALIARLRERYREVLRRGIIDSREDADVLLLAYEMDATLVTADEGLRTWADKVGVKLIHPSNFRSVLEHLS